MSELVVDKATPIETEVKIKLTKEAVDTTSVFYDIVARELNRIIDVEHIRLISFDSEFDFKALAKCAPKYYNEIFECSACKKWLSRYGSVGYIDSEGKAVTIWDRVVDAPDMPKVLIDTVDMINDYVLTDRVMGPAGHKDATGVTGDIYPHFHGRELMASGYLGNDLSHELFARMQERLSALLNEYKGIDNIIAVYKRLKFIMNGAGMKQLATELGYKMVVIDQIKAMMVTNKYPSPGYALIVAYCNRMVEMKYLFELLGFNRSPYATGMEMLWDQASEEHVLARMAEMFDIENYRAKDTSTVTANKCKEAGKTFAETGLLPNLYRKYVGVEELEPFWTPTATKAPESASDNPFLAKADSMEEEAKPLSSKPVIPGTTRIRTKVFIEEILPKALKMHITLPYQCRLFRYHAPTEECDVPLFRWHELGGKNICPSIPNAPYPITDIGLKNTVVEVEGVIWQPWMKDGKSLMANFEASAALVFTASPTILYNGQPTSYGSALASNLYGHRQAIDAIIADIPVETPQTCAFGASLYTCGGNSELSVRVEMEEGIVNYCVVDMD